MITMPRFAHDTEGVGVMGVTGITMHRNGDAELLLGPDYNSNFNDLLPGFVGSLVYAKGATSALLWLNDRYPVGKKNVPYGHEKKLIHVRGYFMVMGSTYDKEKRSGKIGLKCMTEDVTGQVAVPNRLFHTVQEPEGFQERLERIRMKAEEEIPLTGHPLSWLWLLKGYRNAHM